MGRSWAAVGRAGYRHVHGLPREEPATGGILLGDGSRQEGGVTTNPDPATMRRLARQAEDRRSKEIVAESEEKRRLVGHGPPYDAIDERRWHRYLEEKGATRQARGGA